MECPLCQIESILKLVYLHHLAVIEITDALGNGPFSDQVMNAKKAISAAFKRYGGEMEKTEEIVKGKKQTRYEIQWPKCTHADAVRGAHIEKEAEIEKETVETSAAAAPGGVPDDSATRSTDASSTGNADHLRDRVAELASPSPSDQKNRVGPD